MMTVLLSIGLRNDFKNTCDCHHFNLESVGIVFDSLGIRFNLAKMAPAILPVVLEPEMTKISKWGWNRVALLKSFSIFQCFA